MTDIIKANFIEEVTAISVGDLLTTLEVVYEFYLRGFEFAPIDLYESHATKFLIKDGKLLTNGGRVLGATATADTLENAIKDAYKLVEQISFENAYYRHDIGARALLARKD